MSKGTAEDVWDKLYERQEKSYQTREDSGRFRNIFKTDIEGFKLLKLKEGEHLVDIVPYRAGKHDPVTKEGVPSYVLDLWVHRGIGATEDSFICLKLTYGKPCPICEDIARISAGEDYDEDYVKKIKAKRRCVYNMVCYDSDKEEDMGVQVYEVSHFYFEKNITVLAKKRRGKSGANVGGGIGFAHPKHGKSISFVISGQKMNTKYEGFSFEDRDYELSKDILQQAFVLDEIIHIPDYDEVKEAYESGAVPEQEEAPVQSRRSRGRQQEEDSPRSGRASRETRRRPEPEPESPPDDDDIPSEQTESKSKSRSEQKVKEDSPECPGGGLFGKDTEQLPGCDNCDVWDDCAAAKEASEPKRSRRK